MKLNSLFKALISPWSLLVIFFCSSTFFIFQSDIYPFCQDDTIYFNAARQFSDNQTMYGSTIINFEYSKIGEFNWYGPGYHLMYGIPSIIFGFNDGKTSLLLHVFLWTIIIALLMHKFPKHRLTLCILMIASPFYYYHFNFYPVIVNTFFTTISFLIMVKITEDKEKNKLSLILSFIFSILFGAFLRITHVFSFALLYCRAITKRKFLLLSVCFILLIGLTWLYQTYFCAPMFFSADETIKLLTDRNFLSFGIIFIQNFIHHSYDYFKMNEIHDIQLWLTLTISIIAPLFLSKKKFENIRPIYLGLLIMNLAYIIVLLALYTGRPVYLNKQLIILLPANFIFNIVYIIQTKLHKNIFLFINLLFFPFTLAKINYTIASAQQYQYAKNEVDIIKSVDNLVYQNIKEDNNKVVNILIDQHSFLSLKEIQYSAFFCELPFVSNYGNNLKYIFIIHPHEEFSIDERGDYLLSLTNMPTSNKLSLVSKSPGLFLYKINKAI
jgi:hypothetical protein